MREALYPCMAVTDNWTHNYNSEGTLFNVRSCRACSKLIEIGCINPFHMQ